METKDFSPHVKHMHRNVAQERFDLFNGQFFATYLFKNLYWVLDGETIGFGDLREEDIRKILDGLEPGEEFLGFNEHHGSQYQQMPEAQICIKNGSVSFPYQMRVLEEQRARVK